MENPSRSPLPRKRGGTRAWGADNRGFSLVELMVAIVILGFVTVILSSFVRTGSMLYRRVSGMLSLQIQSQLALARLQETIWDANKGLCFEASADGRQQTLYVFVSEDSVSPDSLLCHMFRLDTEENMLYYESKSLTGGEKPVMGAGAEMTDNVTDFSIVFHPELSGDGECKNATRMDISLSFELLGSTYTGKVMLSPRNSPLCAYRLDTLTDALS